MAPTINDLRFPIVCFGQGLILPKFDRSELEICGKSGLTRGWFNGLFIVDSAERGFSIRCARQIAHVGPFFGLRLFKSPRIKVELCFDTNVVAVSLEQLKQRILDDMRNREEEWAAVDPEYLRSALNRARSVQEIAELLR